MQFTNIRDYNTDVEVKRGDIFWVDLPHQGNHLQYGLRPCVVVQNNTGNYYSPTVLVCPITTKRKNDQPTHLHFNLLGQPSTVLCEQILTVDKNQLQSYGGSLEPHEMRRLTLALAASILVD